MKNVIVQGSFNKMSAPTTSSSAMEWATWLTLITARSPSDSSLRSLVIIRGLRNLFADHYLQNLRSQLYPEQRKWWVILTMLSFTWLVYKKVMCAPDHYHSTTWGGAKRCVCISSFWETHSCILLALWYSFILFALCWAWSRDSMFLGNVIWAFLILV